MKLLIVDDEPTILETVDMKMRREGYTTFTADSAEEGMRLFRKVKPDLVLLDIMLPHRSGYDFCRTVRHESSIPIIFMSARGTESDKLKGFEMGGDDYVTKPFNLGELAARVKAVLRRSPRGETTGPVESGDLSIDPGAHEVRKAGELLSLSPREFALLNFLVRNPGQAFSRESLLDRVWGPDAFVNERTVDVHVRWLRTRIETDPDRPVRLVTVRGIGYKFVA